MEMLFILGLLAFLAGPILAIVALVKIGEVNRRLAKLKEQMAQAPAQVFERPVAKAAEAKPAKAAEVAVEKIAEPIKPQPETPKIKSPVPPLRDKSDFEKALAARWFVWVGGVAVALAGLLFVKYAHDNGLIPPIARVVIGLAAAAALVAAGEWLRRRSDAIAQSYVPAALSAAGIVIAFGVIYAAYALYEILPAGLCFPLLVAIGLGAMWLSLRQGPLIGALGLVGSFAAPMLVPSDQPNVVGFFLYLTVIIAAALALLRLRAWWWLGFAAVAGGLAWSVLWLNGYGASGSEFVIGGFALVLGAAATFLPRDKGILNQAMGSLVAPKLMSQPMWLAVAGLAAMSAILWLLVHTANFSTIALLVLAIGMLVIAGFGWLRDGMVAAPLLAGLGTLFTLAGWPGVGFHEWALDERGVWSTVPGLIEPPRFRNAMLVALLAFTGLGVAGILRRREVRPWALLASASAFLFLFVLWGRADWVMSNGAWVGCGVVLAVGLGLLADRIASWEKRGAELLLGGCALLLWFAADRAFDGLPFVLALAALATAAAFATRRHALPALGWIANGFATVTAVRLFIGNEFWGEATTLAIGQHWPIIGYGIPAVLFWFGSRWLAGEHMTRFRVALEGIALGLAIALVSLELRVLIGGGITKDKMGLLELGAHGAAWLGAAYGLAYRQGLFSSFVSLWGGRALLAGGTLAALAALTVFNPVITGDIVEGGRAFNSLWLAYLVPVPLFALMARKLAGLGIGNLRGSAGIFALVLLMTFVTLQVKRLFQDFTIEIAFLSDAESYTTSVAWLIMAIAIFLAGIRLDRQNIRYAGLALMVLTALKVFLFDVSGLGGLWRIASFLGLGLCLIGVGLLHARFLQKPKEEGHILKSN